MAVRENNARLFKLTTSPNLLPSTPVCRSMKSNPDVHFAWAHGGLDCAAVAFGGATRQPPLVSFPSRVPVSPHKMGFASPSDHTSLGFVSLLFFGFSLEGSWARRGLLRRGLRGAATQPPFDQFLTRVPLFPRKITIESPSDRTFRSPFASLPRFAFRRQLGSSRGVSRRHGRGSLKGKWGVGEKKERKGRGPCLALSVPCGGRWRQREPQAAFW